MSLYNEYFVKALLVCLLFVASISYAEHIERNAAFSIDDYFALKHVAKLCLSSDGAMIAFVITLPSLQSNTRIKNVYVKETEPNAKPKRIDAIQNAQDFTWVPGSHDLAFLLSLGESTQVYSLNIESNNFRQHTRGNNSVEKYRFAPIGGALAWLSRIEPQGDLSSLFERLHSGTEGVVIEPETTFAAHFINPDWPNVAARMSNRLWIKEVGSPALPVEIPGQVKSFYWSPDASMLSIAYVDDRVPVGAYFDMYTSVGVYTLATRKFTSVGRAQGPSETRNAIFYSGGEWLPDTNRFILRRSKEYERFRDIVTEWTIIDISTFDDLNDSAIGWREIEMYGRDPEPAFLALNEDTIYSNKTHKGKRSLYQLTPFGFTKADIIRDIQGDISHFQFNADFTVAAYVNASMMRPPEIYSWRKGYGSTKLTALNQSLATKRLPNGQEVFWRSNDGTEIQGWLLEPSRTDDNSPFPVLTFVHGGPGLAITDNFAQYFTTSSGGKWPYPFEVLALNGVAVFFPNYRGTMTFGRDFAHPDDIEQEAAEDIISGIENLVTQGIADPDRLAISGHSHGAWLGSYVMTKAKIFRAGSFAEGIGNKIMTYAMAPEFGNREIQDIQFGASLYDNPSRYIVLSPDLHFSGLNTAVLFESGAKSPSAIATIGSLKAARRAGMPAEFIAYPKTGHNLRAPLLQKESATRNLDWFRFWVLGEEHPDPAKADQYTRWRTMRDEQCAQPKDQDKEHGVKEHGVRSCFVHPER